jgi:serine/threonine-protein kinase
VALKVMARHLLSNDEAKRRFAREAALTMGLRHPNIVRTLDRGEHEGHTFIALEYLEGETLRERLRRDGRLPWRHAVAIAADIASALDEVHHANVIHRDIKSANIMLAGPSATPKLTDFGLAYGEDLSVMTQSGHLIGTMAYMSPEQVASGDAQPAWDLYGLGVVLYEMLTGVVPFAAKESLALMRAIAYEDVPPPTGKHADIPAAVAAVVMKMLAKAPSSRYPNAAEVEAALRALLA